jgi:hypothetical protein
MVLLARLFPPARGSRPAAAPSRRRRPKARHCRGRSLSPLPSLATESLEPRALLAVSATLAGGDLLITYNEPGDLMADISSDGTNYTVTGTGLASKTFKIADVTGVISVFDNAALGGQQFKVLTGTALANPIQVNANVEATLLSGGIAATTAGDVLIGSAEITLANDISTAATGASVEFGGAVSLAGPVQVSTGEGAGDITFSSSLDGAKTLVLTAGTGAIGFTGAIGAVAPLAGIEVEAAASFTASSTVVLDGSAPNARPTGIELQAVNNVTLTTPGSEIRNFGYSGLSFGSGSTGSTIANITFRDNASAGINVFHGDFTGSRIQRNTISGSDAGIVLNAARSSGGLGFLTNLLIGGGVDGDETLGNTLADNTDGVQIRPGTYSGTVIGGGNEIIGSTFAGIILQWVRVNNADIFTGVNDLTIAGNFIGVLRDGTPAGNPGAGILVTSGDHEGTVIQSNRIVANGVGIDLRATVESPSGPPIPDPFLFDLLIGGDKTAGQGNVIENNTTSGIEVNAGDYYGTKIQGNEIRGNAQQGIFLNAAGGALEWLAIGGLGAATVGNEIAENGVTTGQNGILASAGDLGLTFIVGNTIRGNGDPVTHTGNGILVEGSNLSIGIPPTDLWETFDFPAYANTITGNAANGVEVRGANAEGNLIVFNSIYENGYVDESDPGVNTIVGEGIALTAGGNGGALAPEILGVVNDSVSGVIRVSLVVPAVGDFLVQLFDNTFVDERGIFPADPSGFEGRKFVGGLGDDELVSGNMVHVIEIPANRVAPGNWITATASRDEVSGPAATSPFSAAMQVPQAPVLAVGSDGPLVWVPHYNYRAVSGNVLRLGGLTVTEANRLVAMRGRQIFVSADGRSEVATATVANVRRIGGRAVNMVLRNISSAGGSLAGTAGRLEPGPLTLPTARFYDASTGDVVLDVGAEQITAALATAGVEATAADAFVNRFQGGLRVASGDVDGDGFADLVTAPGASPTRPAATFGNATRIVTIYSGNPAAPWESVSLDVSSAFPGYSGGFQVTLGDVLPEAAGSGVLELIVAGTNTVAVYELAVAERGGLPVIDPVPAAIWTIGPRFRITGLAAGDFSAAENDEVVLATTGPSGTALRTFTIDAGSFQASRSAFWIRSYVQADPQRRLRDVFAAGATLAVGDVDGAADGKPELVMAAASQGLANFRVLANDLVATGTQTEIYTALAVGNGYTRASRSQYVTVNGRRVWQPAGGPDYFAGIQRLPNAFARGINAPLFVAVVNADGRTAGGQVFAALGPQNTTSNMIRRLAWSSLEAAWNGTDAFQVQPSGRTRFPVGGGLRLG